MVLFMVVLAACSSGAVSDRGTTAPAPTSTSPRPSAPGQRTASTTRGGELLPPGAFNPDVTQATIGSTICVRGWTATIRPPPAYTGRLKREQMAARGLPGTAADYEEDHFIPLELGGAPRDPDNLWPQPRRGPDAADGKDAAELRLKRDVCAGRLSLDEARRQIADPRNWH